MKLKYLLALLPLLLVSCKGENNRQAAGEPLSEGATDLALQYYCAALYAVTEAYDGLLLAGVCKEQARAILPSAMYTTFRWTCSLQALFHFISLRMGEGAQSEIVAYAQALLKLGRPVAPEAFDAFASNNYQF